MISRDDNDEDEVAVIVSEMEHHSNLLPWREAAKAKVYLAESDVYGRVDVGKLDMLLTKLRKQKRCHIPHFTEPLKSNCSYFIHCFQFTSTLHLVEMMTGLPYIEGPWSF